MVFRKLLFPTSTVESPNRMIAGTFTAGAAASKPCTQAIRQVSHSTNAASLWSSIVRVDSLKATHATHAAWTSLLLLINLEPTLQPLWSLAGFHQ